MTFEDIAKLLEAADSGWGVLALAIIGLYALIWRFGGKLLQQTRESSAKAGAANDAVKEMRADLQTNHGSENMGEAIDRLTGWMAKMLKEQKRSVAERSRLNKEVGELRDLLMDHLLPHDPETENEYSVIPEEDGGPCQP